MKVLSKLDKVGALAAAGVAGTISIGVYALLNAGDSDRLAKSLQLQLAKTQDKYEYYQRYTDEVNGYLEESENKNKDLTNTIKQKDTQIKTLEVTNTLLEQAVKGYATCKTTVKQKKAEAEAWMRQAQRAEAWATALATDILEGKESGSNAKDLARVIKQWRA